MKEKSREGGGETRGGWGMGEDKRSGKDIKRATREIEEMGDKDKLFCPFSSVSLLPL
ncbi:MAG: hypothetical protein IJZ86_09690 [Bacteroides sp.]|nr:hypothetical protein [Bacteroides sp.]